MAPERTCTGEGSETQSVTFSVSLIPLYFSLAALPMVGHSG